MIPRARAATLVVSIVLLGLYIDPRSADAQGRWTITPSLTLREEYTDNLFGTSSDTTSDFITSIVPGIALDYQGRRLTFSGNYSITGEIYADNSDLNNFGDNQRGGVNLMFRVDPQLTLTLAAYYAKSNDLSVLLLQPAPVGVTAIPTSGTGRTDTETYTVLASASYQFNTQWSGDASYTFTALDQDNVPLSTSHQGSLGVSYQLTPLDKLFLTATASIFEDDDTTTSYSGVLAWARRWTPQLTTTVGAGPEVTEGTIRGTVNGSLSYQISRELSAQLNYFYGTGLVVGEVGPSTVSTLTGSVTYQPLRDLVITGLGGWTWAKELEGSSADAVNTYVLSLAVSYRLTDWLSASLTYGHTYDDGGGTDSIHENRVSLGLTASYAFPLPR